MKSMDRIQFSIRLLVLFSAFALAKLLQVQYSDIDHRITYLATSNLIDLVFLIALSPFILARLRNLNLSGLFLGLLFINLFVSSNTYLLFKQLLNFTFQYPYYLSLIFNVLAISLLAYLCFGNRVQSKVTLTSQ